MTVTPVDDEVSALATQSDLSGERARLELKLESTKASIIKWMFIFWAGQTGIMVGILALFGK